MLFSSQVFLFYFLPALLLLALVVPRRHRILLLTVASYVFYGWWNWKFLLLLGFSTTFDYACGLAIHRSTDPRARRALLAASVVTDLSLLGFFKYFMFANRSLAEAASWLGLAWPDALLALQVTLPVGISFYTFQSMSYTIDIYRGLARPTRSLLDFACYLSMFPQLVAGPIVRYTHIEAQLANPRYSAERFWAGVQFFVLGLAKKVLLADSVSVLADAVFDGANPAALSGLDAAVGVLAYTLQIYFDFSGYSDMAVGLGLFLGYDFPRNFDSPYRSRSITEFWRRWHITLSTWLRDYLFLPVLYRRAAALSARGMRDRPAQLRAYLLASLLTMTLGGLWHGASWHFVVWGVCHGLLLMLERLLGRRNPLLRLPAVAQVAVTFALVAVSWVVFRAPDLGAARAILGRVVTGSYATLTLFALPVAPVGLAAVAVGTALAFGARNTWEISCQPSWWKTIGLLALFLLCLAFLFGAVSHPFLYFQF